MLLNFLPFQKCSKLTKGRGYFYTVQGYMVRIVVSANKDLKLIVRYIKQVERIGFKLS